MSSTQLFRPFLAVLLLIAALVAAPAHAQDGGSVNVKEYAVFVDLPTAFAFVKLPTGWKFVGKLDTDQLRNLPEGTVTSLLPADEADVQVASATARTPAAQRKN